MVNKNNKAGASELEKVLSKCTQEDFDGHTCFAELSPAQRIDWLDGLREFVHECKGLAARRL